MNTISLDIRSFGADTQHSDNAPFIQKAVDSAAESGGGRVTIPDGTFRSGMIELRSHVELHLSHGACLKSVLEAIPDPLSKAIEPTTNNRRWLIGGVGVKGAAITGDGIIDGSGSDFWEIDPEKEYPLFGQRYWPKFHRPKGLIHFRNSEHIALKDFTLKNAPCYAVWLLGCDGCSLTHLKITAPLESPNTDGIDLDCCSSVTVSGCDISTGDDAIAIKSDIDELGYHKTCEKITVSNCRLRTSSCGIRVGYEGDGELRDCVFQDNVIYQSMIGISIMSVLDPENPRGTLIRHGAWIHDITFSDMAIDAEQTFNLQHLKMGGDVLSGKISRIHFKNLDATAHRGSYIGGLRDRKIEDLDFRHINMTLSGHMGSDFCGRIPEPYPVWNDLAYSGIPWGFYFRHVENLTMKDSVIRCEQASGHWQDCFFRSDNVSGQSFSNVSYNREVSEYVH